MVCPQWPHILCFFSTPFQVTQSIAVVKAHTIKTMQKKMKKGSAVESFFSCFWNGWFIFIIKYNTFNKKKTSSIPLRLSTFWWASCWPLLWPTRRTCPPLICSMRSSIITLPPTGCPVSSEDCLRKNTSLVKATNFSLKTFIHVNSHSQEGILSAMYRYYDRENRNHFKLTNVSLKMALIILCTLGARNQSKHIFLPLCLSVFQLCPPPRLTCSCLLLTPLHFLFYAQLEHVTHHPSMLSTATPWWLLNKSSQGDDRTPLWCCHAVLCNQSDSPFCLCCSLSTI